MKSTHSQHAEHAPAPTAHAASSSHHPYRNLVWMVGLMFLAMYGLMYAMVDRLANIYVVSLNQFYMAMLMTGAMLVIELLIMGGMYPNKRRNAVLLGLATVVTLGSWFAIREQTGIGDRQFLRSMIPHHAGALLMCGEAAVTDERIVALCRQIETSQAREIELMKELLADAEGG
jgi:hypothetical protein